jgi:hypothetical protein
VAAVTALCHGLDRGFVGGWTTDPELFVQQVRATSLPACVTDDAADVGPPYTDSAGVECVVKRWTLASEDARRYHQRLEALAWWLIDGSWCRP